MTPERRRQQTRDHLLDAAAEVFSRRGFHGATLDEVADTAGYSKGALYFHFENKEDLFREVRARSASTMIEEYFAAARQRATTGFAALREADRRLHSTPEEWALRTEFVLHGLRDPELRAALAADERKVVAAVTTMAEDACREEGIEPPLAPETLARLYVALFQGVARQRAIDPDGVPEGLFASLIHFVEGALRTFGTSHDRSS